LGEMEAGGEFCPQCGKPTHRDDRFCRQCGAKLSEAANGDTAVATTPRRWRRPLMLGGATLAAIGAALAVLLVTGVLGGSEGVDPATRQAFQSEMKDRDALFKVERQYLTALRDARRKLSAYNADKREYDAENKRIQEEFADEFDACARFTDVPCPDPDYPDAPKVPTFGPETREMRAVEAELAEMRARLGAATPRPRLRLFHEQLEGATESLRTEAEHNADVLDEAVTPPEGESAGELDARKIRTLRKDVALPPIKQLNRTAQRLIREFQLDPSSYDVPGGRDFDPNDHSDSV
jgi:hypothetical protein